MKYIIATILLVVSNFVFSQSHVCGAEDDLIQKINQTPALNQIVIDDNINKKAFIASFKNTGGDKSGIYKIPVIVHLIGTNVITKFSPNNYAKVREQINILNEDFGKITGTNGDGNGVDTEIEFCFASTDPNNQPTIGITNRTGSFPLFDISSHPNNLDSDYSLKHLVHWPEDEYMNIYVAELALTLSGDITAGYGTFPSGLSTHPDLDGIVINSDYFGRTNHTEYGAGRTLTHEVGHWLNLKHTWGNYPWDCSSDDDIDDTPICSKINYADYNNSCLPRFNPPNQCTTENNLIFSTDLRQTANYMDYSDDLCRNMFTQGQADWMVASLLTDRPFLWNAGNTICDYDNHCSNGIHDVGIETGVDCGGLDCPPCYSGGGGSAGDPCPPTLQEGYLVNWGNNHVTEVCLGEDIILSGYQSDQSCPQAISVSHSVKRKNGLFGCSMAGAYECNNPLFRCSCGFAKLFISITLVNDALVPTGTEHSKWINFQYTDFGYTANNSPGILSFNLNTTVPLGSVNVHPYYPSQSIIFQAGSTYRIKLASGENGWTEHTKYIHFYEANRVINNATVSSNVYGESVTINNSTVDANVTAKEEITVNPNSTLLSGTYEINSVNCGSFSRPASQGGNGGGVNDREQHISTLEVIPLFEEENDFVESNFNIYPNPTTGVFNIDVNTLGGTALIEVYSIVGQRVYNKITSDNSLIINVADEPKGIYFVKVTVGSNTYNEKVVYQ